MAGLALSLAAVISVLAFGGEEALHFMPAQLILLAAAFWRFWKEGWPLKGRLGSGLLAILVAIPLLQIIPLPNAILDLLAPGRMNLVQEFAATGAGVQLPSTMSLHSYATRSALLRLLCYLMAFLIAYQSYQLGQGRRILSRTLIALGIIEAIYGMVQFLTGWQFIYTYPKTSSFTMASGTYVNYNHFAGLLEMVLPFLVVQSWLHPQHGSSQERSRTWRQLLSGSQLPRWMLHFGLLLVVFLALIFSQSRSGILAGIAGVIVSGALALPKGSRGRALLGGGVIVGLLLVYSTWIGLTPVLDRFESLNFQSQAEQSRIVIWKDTLSLIRDFPIFGSGLGTFSSVSLRYQTMPVTVRYEHAHNDYLEFAAEIGIAVALILFGSLWVIVIRVAKKSISLDRWSEKRLAAACAGAMTALLLHGLTDFNLQIPANALIFSWIAGTAACLTSRRVSETPVIPPAPSRH